MAISTNQKPTIYRNLYENTAPEKWTLRTRYIIYLIADNNNYQGNLSCNAKPQNSMGWYEK